MTLRVVALTRSDLATELRLFTGMHRLRARVFRDRLEWDVAVAGDMEIDLYDAEEATYLLVVADDGKGGDEVVGHVRLLPTTGPNMLADTFPFLATGTPPRDPGIVESSRFCVDTSRVADLAGPGLRQATLLLFAAILEWGLEHEQRALATVTDTRMERILRRTGWPLVRLGPATTIGVTDAVAGILPINEELLATMRGAAGISDSLLRSPKQRPCPETLISDRPETLPVAA